MPHIHSIFPSLSLLAALLLWSSLTVAVGQSEIRYDAKAGLLSVHTSQMPLRTFLEKIAAETCIKVQVTTDEAHPITLRLDGVPLDTALKAALRGTNHILRYRSAANGNPVVSAVRVVGRGEDVMAAPNVATEHGSPLAVTQQESLEQAKEKDPEYQKSQKISRILQENMRRNHTSGSPPLVVVNRPPTPVREQANDADKAKAPVANK